MPIACLPWYALPETEAAQDALWGVIGRHMRRAGIDAPEALARDVAVPAVFCDPDLLLAQCCGYDIVYGFAASLYACSPRLVTPRQVATRAATGVTSSFATTTKREASPTSVTGCVRSTASTRTPGANALRTLVAPFAAHGRFFAGVKVTGAHLESLALLKSGEADVMAMDCVLHALLARYRPAALAGTRILAATATGPGAADRDVGVGGKSGPGGAHPRGADRGDGRPGLAGGEATHS